MCTTGKREGTQKINVSDTGKLKVDRGLLLFGPESFPLISEVSKGAVYLSLFVFDQKTITFDGKDL